MAWITKNQFCDIRIPVHGCVNTLRPFLGLSWPAQRCRILLLLSYSAHVILLLFEGPVRTWVLPSFCLAVLFLFVLPSFCTPRRHFTCLSYSIYKPFGWKIRTIPRDGRRSLSELHDPRRPVYPRAYEYSTRPRCPAPRSRSSW